MIHADENGKITHITQTWAREDIETQLNERGITNTIFLIDKILESIDRGFDASIGVNWDVIDAHIDWHVNGENNEAQQI